ncbi:hypothetical protein A7310_04075 [Bacillus velezensis]|nr:hypothetical protein A7310_04075 [Bacillus velezensis]
MPGSLPSPDLFLREWKILSVTTWKCVGISRGMILYNLFDTIDDFRGLQRFKELTDSHAISFSAGH